ncbi:unnamed protein product [Allacma fusca]|uniref:Metalloendopeptidase n=1 Tax=Allacma fusca TaxID=39272 RepID=A0A8J2KZD1_9HEXA|nr:unnamed protein product [Allacma fusca]
MDPRLKKKFCYFYNFANFGILILFSPLTFGLPIENHDVFLPGEPLNPDEFAAGKVYLANIESGLIQEEPDDPTKELPPKDSQSDQAGSIWNGGMIPYMLAERFGDPGAGCFSMIGKRGGPQTLQVGPDCMKRGSIIHEFLHAAGFAHEHQRKDRDQYIDINYKYIRESLQIQFRLLGKTHNTLTSYDYKSILHYSARADCISPCPLGVKTITPKKDPNAQLGQRKGLSSLDTERTNLLYNCPRPSGPANDASSQASNQVMGWIPIAARNVQNFKGCQDFDDRCSFVDVSTCSRNSTWVNFTCRKTCGYCDSACNDYNMKCDQWSRQNQCLEYPQYMLTFCQKSCGLCT